MANDTEPRRRKRNQKSTPTVPEIPHRQTNYSRYDIANKASQVIDSYKEDISAESDPTRQVEIQHNIDGVEELLRRLDRGSTGLVFLAMDISSSRQRRRRDQPDRE